MTTVTISAKAEAVAALETELKEIEALQLKVGEEMAKLLFDQMRLAEKSHAMLLTLERIIK